MKRKNNIERFIVLSHPRSGTSYFCGGVLSKHKYVGCFDEIFNNTANTLKVMDNLGMPPFNLTDYQDPFDFLNVFFQKASEKRKKYIIGYKLFPNQIDKKNLLQILQTHKVLLLHRLNMPQAALSYFIAKRTGQWGARTKEIFKPIVLNYAELLGFVQKYETLLNTCKDFLDTNKIPYLELHYESLFTQSSLEQVTEFFVVGCPV